MTGYSIVGWAVGLRPMRPCHPRYACGIRALGARLLAKNANTSCAFLVTNQPGALPQKK